MPASTPRSRWKTPAVVIGALAALSAALLLFRPPGREAQPRALEAAGQPPSLEGGPLALRVYRTHDGGSEEATSGTAFRAGDRLRFRITIPTPGFVSLLRSAPNGTLHTTWPPGEGSPRELPAGQDLPLDAELELDDAPGRETLWLVLCKSAGRCIRVQTAFALSCPQDCIRTPFFVDKAR